MESPSNISRRPSSENLPAMPPAMKVNLDVESGEVPMSYAEAKEIALLRLELRACWNRADQAGARLALARLTHIARNDNELAAEARRWAVRLAA